MTHKLFYLFYIPAIFIAGKCYAQASVSTQEEKKLVSLYSRIIKSMEAGNDSTEYYSGKFNGEFINLIKTNPATMSYPFQRLADSNFCYIKTSSDGNFRIYSWDTWTGGTMHIFKEIYQYKDNGKIFTKMPKGEEGEPGSFCSKIYTIPVKNKTYYLPISNGVFSTKDVSQSVSVYFIDNNKLIDTAKLFHTKTKRLNSIDVEFDFFSVVDRPERPLELITYDESQKILYIPVVNDKGAVSNKNLLYQLKDDHFEYIGIETGKRK